MDGQYNLMYHDALCCLAALIILLLFLNLISNMNTAQIAIIVSLLSLCAGCGTYEQTIDAALRPYLNRYLALKGGPLTFNVDMVFATQSDGIVGVCIYGDFRVIEIDPDYWFNRASEQDKTTIIFHELGHCDLNRDHDMKRLSNNKPKSIMWPSLFDLAGQEDYYYAELFRNSGLTLIGI